MKEFTLEVIKNITKKVLELDPGQERSPLRSIRSDTYNRG